MKRSLGITLVAGMSLLAACQKNQAQNDQNAADMSVIDNNLTAPPGDVETLPPDESAVANQGLDTNDADSNDENDID